MNNKTQPAPSMMGRQETGRMSSSQLDHLELLVASFSSLLSSAHTNGVHHALLPPEDKTRSLSNLLSYIPSNHAHNHIHNQYNNHPHQNQVLASCTLPCLKLRSEVPYANRRLKNVSLQEVMALNLSSPIVAHRSNIDEIPKLLLQSTSDSFQELLSSRLRVSMQAITKTMLKLGSEGTDAMVLRRLLTSSEPVKITTVVTSFQVVAKDDQHKCNDSNSVIRPLVFETIFDLSILGKMYTVSVQAPGTINATLNPTDYRLLNVKIVFDTMSLLKAMMTQVRAVVKKAVKRAASITSTVTTFRKKKESTRTSSTVPNSLPSSNNRTTPQDNLLASYPEHLRETVQHFLPEKEADDSTNIEGFPPNLMNTLKSLSGGSAAPDVGRQIHQGLFSWMNNDDIMLRQSTNSNRSSDSSSLASMDGNSFLQRKRSLQNEDYSIQQPLSKRNKKVSFILPHNDKS
jgi:hypothetical protein